MRRMEQSEQDKEEDSVAPTEDGCDKNRSERKRKREKQRRSDLSSAFDELGVFLAEIEPNIGVGESKKKAKGRADPDPPGGITRLDLVSQGLVVMKRLHRENKELKRAMEQIRSAGMPSIGQENVLVMVPSLTPVDGHRLARATYPAFYSGGSMIGQPPPIPGHSQSYSLDERRLAAQGFFPPTAVADSLATQAARAEAWAASSGGNNSSVTRPPNATGPWPPEIPGTRSKDDYPSPSAGRPPSWRDDATHPP